MWKISHANVRTTEMPAIMPASLPAERGGGAPRVWLPGKAPTMKMPRRWRYDKYVRTRGDERERGLRPPSFILVPVSVCRPFIAIVKLLCLCVWSYPPSRRRLPRSGATSSSAARVAFYETSKCQSMSLNDFYITPNTMTRPPACLLDIFLSVS